MSRYDLESSPERLRLLRALEAPAGPRPSDAALPARSRENAIDPHAHQSPPEAPRLDAPVAEPLGPSYYGLPLLKEPVWIGAVPLYFWVGGAAGTGATLASLAGALGGRRLRGLARQARWLAAIGDTIGAGLLIYDLGRPARFFNMLRVLNLRSPMSVGSWVLAGSGAANGAAALFGGRRGLLGALGSLGGAVGGLLGLPLAGYTGVLLANSAIPVWNLGRRSLPVLFLASGAATAGSLLSLTATSPPARRSAERLALAGKAAELAATWALEREVAAASPRAAEPLRRGRSGALLTTATVLTGASLLLGLVPGRRGKRTAALLGAAGSLALRFAVYHAGKASARDPHASFASQRHAT